jgi:predicted RNase H-like HicB family nuclease
MTYRVFLQQTAGDSHKATPLAFPDCVVVGKTREEALANLKAALDARLSEGEIVTVEAGEPEHPWLKWAGMFKDHPTFDEFQDEIEADRREIDEAERQRAEVSPCQVPGLVTEDWSR